MSNQLTTVNPVQDFQERIIKKLRADIGELLPDEALANLVQRAVDETFFKPIKIDEGYGRTRTEPSWFIKEVTKVAEPMLKEAAKKFVEENKDKLEEGMRQYLDAANLTLMVVSAMQIQMMPMISSLADQIVTRMRANY